MAICYKVEKGSPILRIMDFFVPPSARPKVVLLEMFLAFHWLESRYPPRVLPFATCNKVGSTGFSSDNQSSLKQ
jgi:hypothetical protein